MKLLDLLIQLREDVVGVIGSVEDSNGRLNWDNTRPNWSTRSILQDLFDRSLGQGAQFGIYLVTRHCSCPSKNHAGYPISRGWHGIDEWGDKKYIWTGEQVYQGDRVSPCACTPNSKPVKHHVIEELVIRKHGVTKRHHSFVHAISDIQQAIDNAGDNRPRSAIREWLLRALLQLNDSITPQSVAEYIAHRKSNG